MIELSLFFDQGLLQLVVVICLDEFLKPTVIRDKSNLVIVE
jgi:hypothetical protein